MERFSDIVGLLRGDADRVREQLYLAITSEIPQGAGMFPPASGKVSRELIDALSYIFLSANATGALPDSAVLRLRAWALDLRRFGFPAASYDAFARIVREVLGAGIEARFVLEDAASEMARAATAADLQGVPAAAAARVSSVRTDNGVDVVRLEAGMPVSYAPGQYLPVMQVGRQGAWRSLAPALPSNPFGQLEFHVDGEITPEVGSYITLGAARGASPRFDAGQLTVVAAGTGAAAAKAIVFHALEMPAPPRTRLALVGDVADRDAFTRLAAVSEWFSVEADPDLAGEVVFCGPHEQVAALDVPADAIRICPDAPADWTYRA
ncbi:hypothetical protein G7Y29_09540 [Corynebacterium qintianiae]|uniref:FAD-binding FR-type domain-containing protein n=1 Tax=Corynebacterium qintianiae TaxID=2709392 RepID=A0A7T0PDM5_9CORY|nr:hypothetical protein [Corynebacterium qintianiae]QPK83068.1 hypothetical protein G7Y29_09540 [Corynebacterium qintianiae]